MSHRQADKQEGQASTGFRVRTAANAVGRDQRGGSMLKIAIAVPLLAFVLSAIVIHGHYFAVDHHIHQLTVEAARATVAGATPGDRQQIAVKIVDDTIDSYPLLRRDRLKVNVTDTAGDPGMYQVTLIYDAKDVGFWSLERFVPLPSSTIQHSSTIRRGGQ